jgi:phosphoribosyl 1,2-cyclic phosphate phosphodiesterase
LNALRNSRHVSHFSVPEAVEFLQKLEPEAAYLTHLSHFVGFHEEVNSRLPENIRLAYDGLTIIV